MNDNAKPTDQGQPQSLPPGLSKLPAIVRYVVDRPETMYAVAPALLFFSLIYLVMAHNAPDLGSSLEDVVTRVVKEGTPLALLAVGVSLVLATGGVDISTAGVAAVGGAVFAALSQTGMHPLACAVLALAVGSTSGFLLGAGVHRGLPPLILSWALGSLWVVAVLFFADLQLVKSTTSRIALGFQPPAEFFQLGHQGSYACLSVLGMAVFWISVTNIPRQARAVGSNRDSATYAGIRTRHVYLVTYALSGACAALAGVFWSLLNAGAQTTEHLGRELVAIAIAILGGTVMTGGYLFLPSVVAAGLFWVAMQTAVQGSNLTAFREHQHQAANALFAALFILLLLPLGKRLGGPTQTITVEQKVATK